MFRPKAALGYQLVLWALCLKVNIMANFVYIFKDRSVSEGEKYIKIKTLNYHV